MLMLLLQLKADNGTCIPTDGVDGMDSLVATNCVSTAENLHQKKVWLE